MIQVISDVTEIGRFLRSPSCEFPLSSVRFQALDYFSSIQDAPFSNQSFIVIKDSQPVCAVVRVSSAARVSFFDQPFRVEFAAAFLNTERTELDRKILEEICLRTSDAQNFDIEIPVAGEATNNLLEKLLPSAEHHSLHIEGFVDLNQSVAPLENNLNESHRRKVRKSKSAFESVTTYCGDIDDSTFDAFRGLHFTAAGRETRSSDSWMEQRRAIFERRASLTTIVDDREVIGGTFSWLSPSAAIYGTGAYDRSKFSSMSISHVTLFSSIQHAQSLGIQRYIVGQVFAPGANEKERNIAFFKRGFTKTREYFHRLKVVQER